MRNRNEFKIDFLIIGAPKCATTWIAACLRKHPQIFLPWLKPLYFLEENREKELKYYKRDFKDCADNQVRGMDFPNFLFFGDKVAIRIKECNPNVKLIVSLRNPIERAYSHYLFDRSLGTEYRSFEKAIREEPEYLEKGFYFKQLKKYLEYFPRKNILVLIYEDIRKDPKKFIQKIFQFLGVDSNFSCPEIYSRVNYTRKREVFIPFVNKWITWFVNYLNKNMKPLFIFLKRKKAGRIVRFIMTWNRRAGRYFFNSSSFQKPPLKESTRKYLISLYQEDIKKLEKLIKRDLSFWR